MTIYSEKAIEAFREASSLPRSVSDQLANKSQIRVAELWAQGLQIKRVSRALNWETSTVCRTIDDIYTGLGFGELEDCRSKRMAFLIACHGKIDEGTMDSFSIDKKLTRRERDFLLYVCEGFSISQMANKEEKGLSTVKMSLSRLYAKLGLNRAPDLFMELVRHRDANKASAPEKIESNEVPLSCGAVVTMTMPELIAKSAMCY